MKAFVTGGTGFIGGRVVQHLIDCDYEVNCLVRRPEKATALRDMGVTIVQGDITDQESMRAGMTGADIVLHCAGWFEVGLSPPLPRVVIGHGALDPVISVEWGRQAHALLAEAGADVSYHESPHMAHSIDPALARELPGWVDDTLGAA